MKLFYSTDEVCTHLGIPRTTLEYYLLEFKINIKKAGRSRKFSHKDIEKLQKIVDLIQKQGHTIEGTKEKLKQKAKSQADIEEIVDRLQVIRKSLVILRDGIETN
ncbi:MerR family transcriptional regulator [Leadbetterella byssophila]|uniref:MerR family transcriptional regulator n=1 Tax=Leadbetterella byssophila TaxID=316068 RepID=UPI0039A333AC